MTIKNYSTRSPGIFILLLCAAAAVILALVMGGIAGFFVGRASVEQTTPFSPATATGEQEIVAGKIVARSGSQGVVRVVILTRRPDGVIDVSLVGLLANDSIGCPQYFVVEDKTGDPQPGKELFVDGHRCKSIDGPPVTKKLLENWAIELTSKNLATHVYY